MPISETPDIVGMNMPVQEGCKEPRMRYGTLKNMAVFLMIGCFPALTGWAENEDSTLDVWSVSENHPAINSQTSSSFIVQGADAPLNERSPLQWGCVGLLIFYQQVISRITIMHCQMEPSCANYSLRAINKHGPLMGVIMTADRIMHEADERKYAPLIKQPDNTKYFDPVENNDFWWRQP
ncbi:MAG: membrane protein insertion efficiency factor YidD [Kiritimatiellae bacterium]|nr:membrane protein insertion efficiency factor YidD [Verrucomicrobiota bacterium]MBU4365659.1 membrane protein insertion efficiency factor YidD [Verrucomicrobiota bacterium]MCG2658830.1 membrane protein insertion efficiency factor YidD [Kiritimatiellia bacterium]